MVFQTIFEKIKNKVAVFVSKFQIEKKKFVFNNQLFSPSIEIVFEYFCECLFLLLSKSQQTFLILESNLRILIVA